MMFGLQMLNALFVMGCTDWSFDEKLLKLEQISISLFTRKAWKIHNLAWLGRWISTFELQTVMTTALPLS